MSLQPDGTAAREGVRIRHYIVSLRYRNPGKAFRIPTSVELAKMFGVARSTVTLELKALTEDGIIIGKRGAAIKRIGTEARKDLELLLGAKVFLDLSVKVRKNWRRDANQIRRFGYGEGA